MDPRRVGCPRPARLLSKDLSNFSGNRFYRNLNSDPKPSHLLRFVLYLILETVEKGSSDRGKAAIKTALATEEAVNRGTLGSSGFVWITSLDTVAYL